jgi:hypothetical protein
MERWAFKSDNKIDGLSMENVVYPSMGLFHVTNHNIKHPNLT